MVCPFVCEEPYLTLIGAAAAPSHLALCAGPLRVGDAQCHAGFHPGREPGDPG